MFKFVVHYLNLSFVLTYMLILTYVFSIDSIDTSITSLYYLYTIPLYYYFILVLLFIILFPFVFNKYLQFVLVIFKTLFDVSLLINFFIFKNYKFHIDSLFIDMALHDLEGLGVSLFGYMIVVTIFILIYGINLYLFKKAKTNSVNTLKVTFIFVILFLANQVIHIWGAYFNQEYITKYTPYFPYYHPTTSASKVRELAIKYPFIVPLYVKDKSTLHDSSSKHGLFHYPKHPLLFDSTQSSKPNIIFIVLESWQHKEMNKKTTPYIYQFSKQNQYYIKHFSSGNVTLTGLFGLMYGLNATDNLKIVQSNPLKYQTLFTKSLKKLNYNLELYTTSNFYRFSFKDMFFGNIDTNHTHIIKNGSSVENDEKIVNELLNSLSNKSQTPWFKFLFLTSSHHSYNYPKKFEQYTPVAKNAEAFLLDSSIDAIPYRNRYKNSLLYCDDLVQKVLEKLSDKLDNTIVVITGDHAEEFNESGMGLWGHGSSFDVYQTQVPLVIHFPKNKPQIIDKRTSHIDIVPTLLKYIGVKNTVTDFSSGVDLNTQFPSTRDLIFASYKDRAYLIDNNIISIGLFTQRYNLYKPSETNVTIEIPKVRILKEQEIEFFKNSSKD